MSNARRVSHNTRFTLDLTLQQRRAPSPVCLIPGCLALISASRGLYPCHPRQLAAPPSLQCDDRHVNRKRGHTPAPHIASLPARTRRRSCFVIAARRIRHGIDQLAPLRMDALLLAKSAYNKNRKFLQKHERNCSVSAHSINCAPRVGRRLRIRTHCCPNRPTGTHAPGEACYHP